MLKAGEHARQADGEDERADHLDHGRDAEHPVVRVIGRGEPREVDPRPADRESWRRRSRSAPRHNGPSASAWAKREAARPKLSTKVRSKSNSSGVATRWSSCGSRAGHALGMMMEAVRAFIARAGIARAGMAWAGRGAAHSAEPSRSTMSMKSRAASRSAASLKADIEIGRAAQHVQQCPQAEAAAAIPLQPEIDAHPLHAGIERGRVERVDLRLAEIAHEKILEVHACALNENMAHRSEKGRQNRSGLC